MDSNIYKETKNIVEDRTDLGDELNLVVKLDQNNNVWYFEEVRMDSRDFGELVNRGILIRYQDGYTISDRSAVEAALSGEQPKSGERTAALMTNLSDRLLDWEIPNRTILPIFMLIVFGFVLRVYHLQEPPLLDGEALIALGSIGLLDHGQAVFPSGVPYQRSPLIHHIIAGSIMIFGENTFALRFPSVIAGTLSIPVIYLIGKKIDTAETGVIAAGLCTFSSLQIAWSRISRYYVFLQLLLLIAVLVYFKFREEKEYQYLVFTIPVIIAAYYSHTGWLFILVFLFVATIIPDLNYSRINITKFGIIILGAIYMSAIVVTNFAFGLDFISGFVGIPVEQQLSIWKHPHSELPPWSFYSSYYPVLTLFALIGTALATKGWNRRILLISGFLFISVFIFSYIGSQLRHVWRPRYLLFTLPFVFLLAARVCSEIVDYAANNFESNKKFAAQGLRSIFVFVFLFSLIVSPVPMDITAQSDAHALSQVEEPQPNYVGACERIGEQILKSDTVISNRPAQVYFWFNQVDYRGNTFQGGISGNNQDRFTGAPVIQNDSEMRNIIRQHDRVWVIYNPYMPLHAEDWVENNMKLMTVAPSPFPSRTPHGLYSEKLQNRSTDEAVYVYTKGINNSTGGTGMQEGCR